MLMYPKLPSNFRIYADKQSELDLKFNHQLCQIQDDYLQKNPELKPEVCWVYGDSPTNNETGLVEHLLLYICTITSI
jgi:hypothetical protein